MLAVALLLLLPFADDHPANSSVALAGDGAPASFEGTAYFIPSMEGMGVMALATAPLGGGSWVHGGAPFSYVEIVVFEALAERTVEVGSGAGVTVYHRDDHADGPAFFAMADEGTLAATLTAYDKAGTASLVTGQPAACVASKAFTVAM